MYSAMAALLVLIVLMTATRTLSSANRRFVNVYDFKDYAKNHLHPHAYNYIESASTRRQTYDENIDAFKTFRLRPRRLRDVSHIDTSTTVQGQAVAIPIGIAPTAFHKWFHPEGVIGTALGAAAKNALMILSQDTGTPLESVHSAVPHGHRWMQAYMVKPRNDMLRHIRRVESAGYQAIVLTIDDVAFRRISYSSLRGEFEFPASFDFVNLPRPVIGGTIDDADNQINTVTWDDVDWLKNVTHLPIILKGILTPEDAELAVRHGVDGLYVSNHGGRTLDGTTASINALWDVVRVVRGRCEVYLDGGIRNGRDVYTALALGAKAVFVGRPAIYGLATNGSQGVQDVLDILTNELESTMALTGVTRVCDISPSYVVKQSYYETLNRPPCRQFSSKQLSVNFVG